LQNPTGGRLGEIRAERHYKNHDVVLIHPERMPNFSEKLKIFFDEHLHEDEEIRFILDGSGYFDVRNERDDEWIRLHVTKGDMLVLPAGIYHRFTVDDKKFIQAMRLFQDTPKWEAISRTEARSETLAKRAEYRSWRSTKLGSASSGKAHMNGSSHVESKTSANGESFFIKEGAAKSLANYPHLRAANGFLYVSGLSSRRPDNTHVGATQRADGGFDLDVKAQTAAVIENIQRVLALAGADLSHVVDVTTFLVDMKDYAGYNEVYNKYFTDPLAAPTRTTVAVHQLPHPNLLIEIKVVAVDPRRK
jgi:cupin superfamily acireductone dioxygenase involved in methionine salvage